MMRSASGMLVMALLTTSVVSGTFAKYVSANKAEDTARVAKWGVTVDASGSLFGQNYLTGTNTPTVSEEDEKISVELGDSGKDNLVAPGSKCKNGITFGISGTPEVDTKVTASIIAKDIYLAEGTYGVMQKVVTTESNFADLVEEGLYSGSLTAYAKVTDSSYREGTFYQLAYTAAVGEDGYYPVRYAWNGDTNTVKITRATELANIFAQKIDADAADKDTSEAGVSYEASAAYDSNTNLASVIDLNGESLTWEWPFKDAEIETGETLYADSDTARDTLLGDLAAGGRVVSIEEEGNTISVLSLNTATGVVSKGADEVGCIRTAFNVKITVEQVD